MVFVLSINCLILVVYFIYFPEVTTVMNVCRVCLSDEANKDISQLKTSKKNGKKGFTEIMAFCLDIQITEDSRVTRKLCSVCFKKILDFYKFKHLALMNDSYLRAALESDGIKVEPTQNDDENPQSEYVTQLENENNDLESEPYPDGVKNELEHIHSNAFGKEKAIISFQEEIFCGIPKEADSSELPDYERNHGDIDIYTNDEHVRKSRKKYQRKEGKLQPKRLKSENDLGYPCKFCDRIFKSLSVRGRHVKFTHEGVHGHCEKCNKDVKHLKHHIMLIHEKNQLKFECEPCGRRFATKYRLQYHACSGSKEQRFTCTKCDKRFWCPRELDRHIRSIHEKEKLFMCQFCSKSFFRKSHLNVHLRTHTKEKPYKCQQCEKGFSTSTGLKHHQYTHSDTQDFQCSVCAKTFAGPKYLRHHMVSHNKERKYPCKYCGVSFARSDTRKTHESNVHEKNILAALV